MLQGQMAAPSSALTAWGSPLPTMWEPRTLYPPVIHILLLPGIWCALIGLSVLVQQTLLDHHLLLTGLRATCNKSDCSSREDKSSLGLQPLSLRGGNPGTSQANNYSVTNLTLLQGPSNKSHKTSPAQQPTNLRQEISSVNKG